MRTRRLILVALVALVLAGACAWLLSHAGPRVPSFQGRSLTTWLEDVQPLGGMESLDPPVLEAVRQMGTNAFPVLANMLAATDTRLGRKLADIDVFGLYPTPAAYRQARALAVFRTLGPDAKGAAPWLAPLVTNSVAGENAIVAMTDIGPDALTRLLEVFRQLDPTRRRALARAVAGNSFHYPANVPFLIACLQDADAGVRREAANDLGATALGTFPKPAPNVVEALAVALRDTDAGVRAQAAVSLGHHGPTAASKIPLLLDSLHDPDPATRANAAQALKEIDPASATMAGLK